jgi:hypothetical protein
MTYHERRAADGRNRLVIDGDSFDIDWVGMDDGLDRDERTNFRFLFQLGSGYMIYLYVIGITRAGAGPWFHTFWTKDCAVAEVEMVEHGPPDEVRCERFVLPRLHDTLVLEGPNGARKFRIGVSTFDARVDRQTTRLEVRFELEDGELVWNTDGWRLGGRPLGAGERVTFADVVRD